jgi:hypothetical protein
VLLDDRPEHGALTRIQGGRQVGVLLAHHARSRSSLGPGASLALTHGEC